MKHHSLSAIILILACAAAPLGAAWAADPAPAATGMTYESKLQACAACHGENGDKPLAPDYPVLHRFLEFWRKNLEGAIHTVRVASVDLIKPAEFRALNGVLHLH